MNPMALLRNGVWLFLLIAFAFSWAVGGVIYQLDAMTKPLLFTGLALLFMSGPMVAALICMMIYDKDRRLAALGLNWRFNTMLIWAWLLPLLLIGGAFLIDLFVSPARYAPAENFAAALEAQGMTASESPMSVNLLLIMQVVMALTLLSAINAILTLTEELGWRGWLWDRWRPLGFWRSSMLIGFVWGVWHAPLIAQGYNFPGMPVWGPVLMTGLMILVSPLIGWVRDAGGSVLHAGLFHGTLNSVAALGLLALADLEFPFRGVMGAGGFVTAAALCVLVFALRKNKEEALAA